MTDELEQFMDEYTERSPTEMMSVIEAVRKRPGMYVGSTDFFGFIHYLVCPVALLLGRRPSRLDVDVQGDRFVVSADVAVPLGEMPNGRIVPFDEIPPRGELADVDGLILNGLSDSLVVEIRQDLRVETLTFRRGNRESREVVDQEVQGERTTLTFTPDISILKVTNVSSTIVKSYLRRLSFLHRGVRFSLKLGDETFEYYAAQGIVDLFAAVNAPYQILHEPIHIVEEDGPLRLEMIFAYQSWQNDVLWSFINNGRAVEGGTHEQGLKDALKKLHSTFQLAEAGRFGRNGVIGIASIRYPGAVWQGCIKAKIGSPELRAKVRKLVVEGAMNWLSCHPEVAEQLRQMRPFTFPEYWEI